MQRIAALLTLSVALLSSVTMQSALAQVISPQPPTATRAAPGASILVRWVDVRGNVFPGGRINRMAWVWSKLDDSDAMESPALRLWLTSQLPADWSPQKVSGDGVKLAEPYRPGASQTMAVDLRSSSGTLRFEFLDKHKRPMEMTLAIRVEVSRPYVLLRPECGKLDLRFLPRFTEGRHLFVGLSCEDSEDGFDIYFFRSKDSSWSQAPGLIQFDPEGKFTAFKFHARKPKVQVVYSQRLFSVGTLDGQKRASEYSVFYHPVAKPSIFYTSGGIGATHYGYSETAVDETLKLNQLSLTGKVNVGVRLVPRLLDFAFNGFATLVPLSHSPSDLPSARWLGLNGRLGYRLPVDVGALEFMFLTGWYYWSMSVSGADYGIARLNGPQLFLMVVDSQAAHRGWWSYFKLAMISDRLQLTGLQNRELALGAGVELSARDPKPYSLTLDIAHTQFAQPETEESDSISMKLLSVTLGVQKAF